MRIVRRLRGLALRHPDLAELALGVAVAGGLLVVSLSQWGMTDLGFPSAPAAR